MARTDKDTRNYCLILYPESADDVKVKDDIIKNYDYAYILHDLDTDENGELKKAHWHIVLRFKDTRSINVLSEELDIPSHRLEYCRNLKGAIRYLTHIDDPDKYQYKVESVKSNFVLSNYFKSNVDEDVQAQAIIDYILVNGIRSMPELTKWCLQNGYFTTLRRGSFLYAAVLKDIK